MRVAGGVGHLISGMRPFIWPCLLLTFVSSGLIQKHAGLAGLAVYFSMVFAAFACCAWLLNRWKDWMNRRVGALLVLQGIAMAGLFILLHPLEDGKGPGKSSDRDEGLEIAVTRMIRGENPYYASSPVAGPLSVLPGEIIISAPFVVIGSVGCQNVFWLVLFVWACSKWSGDPARALAIPAFLMAVSPSMLHEFVSGGDLITNGIHVALMLACCGQAASPKTGSLWRWTACILLGISLASRPNFLLLLPILGAYVWRVAGLRMAVAMCSVAGITSLIITLPFYLHDPAGFTPLIARRKLSLADATIPWAGTLMIATTFIASIGAALTLWFDRHMRISRLLLLGAVVTMLPMLMAVAFSSWTAGFPDFGFMRDRFGLMYLFLAILGWCMACQPCQNKFEESAKTAYPPQ